MDTRIEAAYGSEGLSGFWITWRFDPAEVAVIEDRAFSNLANYSYFVYIHSPKGAYRPSKVESFSAYMEGGRIHFESPAPSSPSVSMPTPRLQALIDAQRTIREVLAEAVDRSAKGGRGVPALLALAFAYGLLHALGPGHRKLALAAYFLARPLQGVAAGTSVALLHAARLSPLSTGCTTCFEPRLQPPSLR